MSPHDPPTLPRRGLLLAGAAALLPLREAAAQAAAGGGDWLQMVQAQHAVLARSFDRLLAATEATYTLRDQLVHALAYQLTAHAVAEENVLYPAIAMAGLGAEADRLYLDQAHAKVMNAQLEMQSRLKDKGNWQEAARVLQAAVLQHANEDEEARLYPQLQARLAPAENALLTQNYLREWRTVSLRRMTG